MKERIVSTDSGWPEVTRDLTTAECFQVGQLLAGLRDAAKDGIFEDRYEGNFWAARTNTCILQGFARGYYVNNGGVCGACLVLPDAMNKSRAIMFACNSMWGAHAEEAMLRDAHAWANERGLQLGSMQPVTKLEWVPF